MKIWSSLSCWKFSEDYFEKKIFCQKIDFHQFMTSWRCEFCWFYQKIRFFALFDPFKPNIWKIDPAYLVANFLKIILKKIFLPKNRFSSIYDVMKVWNLLNLPKKAFFLLFLTRLTQIYEKLTQPILLQIFWRLFRKKYFWQKFNFH